MGEVDKRCRTARSGAVVLLVALAACGSDEGRPPPDFPAADYAVAAPVDSLGPSVGATYTHYTFRSCDWNRGGILVRYAEDAVADTVHDQLRAMRASGIAALRIVVWHMRDVAQQHWGVVPSRGGRLPEPFRSNLVAYLTEVRRFGFRRLTLSFSPQWANSPLRENYDPGRFEENWAFIQDVRELAERFGPDDVRFDLLNEGGVSDYAPASIREQMGTYVGSMWRRYVDRYGAEDVTVSVIAPEQPRDRGHRLENLVAELRAAGGPLPGWFDLHLNYPAAGVAWGLHAADSVLAERGLDQPLAIGETLYDDASVAASIAEFMASSPRPVTDVLEWFKRAGAECEVSPPYRADAYRVLTR